MGKHFPSDAQLAKALRQAALRIDTLAAELQRHRSEVMPIADKLTVHDFIPLLRKATTNGQLMAIVECVETCFIEDSTIVAERDWPYLSTVLGACKKTPGT